MAIFNQSSKVTNKSTAATLIAKGCHITGEVQLSCDIQVDGSIDGKMILEKNLIISTSGKINGEIYADSIIVNGVLEGICYANKIEILENGFISGSIYTDNFSIVSGGKFVGTTHAAEEKDKLVRLSPIETDEEKGEENLIINVKADS